MLLERHKGERVLRSHAVCDTATTTYTPSMACEAFQATALRHKMHCWYAPWTVAVRSCKAQDAHRSAAASASGSSCS